MLFFWSCHPDEGRTTPETRQRLATNKQNKYKEFSCVASLQDCGLTVWSFWCGPSFVRMTNFADKKLIAQKKP
jgi:hypothetical protein